MATDDFIERLFADGYKVHRARHRDRGDCAECDTLDKPQADHRHQWGIWGNDGVVCCATCPARQE